jgi:hypothetical protein
MSMGVSAVVSLRTFRSIARTKRRKLCELDFFENATNAPRGGHVELLAIGQWLRLDGRLRRPI